MDKPHSLPVSRPMAPGVAQGRPISRSKNNPGLWLILIGLLAVGLLPVGAVAAAALYFQVSGAILPGVSAGAVPLGWMTREQAAQAVDQAWNQGRSLVLVDGERQWQTTPAYLGLWVDPGATVQAAYEIGRGADALSDLIGFFQVSEYNLQPVVVVPDPAYARQQLALWSAQVAAPAQDATLRLEGDQVVITPGQPGRTLDVDAALMALLANPRGVLEAGVFPVPFVAVQPQISDLSAAAAEAERLLSQPFRVQAYDPVTDERFNWEANRQTVASWLRIETVSGTPQVGFDPALVSPYLEGLAADLGPSRAFRELPGVDAIDAAFRSSQPVTLGVRYLPTEYVVQPGDTLLKVGWKVGMPFWRVLRANPGLDENSLTPGTTLVVPPLDDQLPLPVVANKRIRIDIGDQRMQVIQDGAAINTFVISTGIDRSPTQPGIYQIQTHEVSAYASVWDLTMPHFMGIYEAWPGFMNGIHGLPTLSNGHLLWANILGHPASYGCIILDLDDAEWLFNWAENGVVVEITE